MVIFSVIIPVYNRPEEIKELLATLALQTNKNFEVLVVEDGSEVDCKKIVESFKSTLAVQYFFKKNSGPSDSRNFGTKHAQGNWLIFLDSDTLVPKGYVQTLVDFLNVNKVDFFGGSDREHFSFTPLQKAISYSMTSFFTTGGIRGSTKSMEKFKPRSFNMGVSKTAFEKINGFSNLRYGEDIDLSIRLEKEGFQSALIEDAFVYHKRRTSIRSFFHQIRHSGEARIALSRRHPGSVRLVHLFPVGFLLGFITSAMLFALRLHVGAIGLLLYISYLVLITIAAIFHSKNVKVGLLASLTSFIQLSAYGIGFADALVRK